MTNSTRIQSPQEPQKELRQRDVGTLEQVMVTPIRRWQFILGKAVPFFLVGCFDAMMLWMVGTV